MFNCKAVTNINIGSSEEDLFIVAMKQYNNEKNLIYVYLNRAVSLKLSCQRRQSFL